MTKLLMTVFVMMSLTIGVGSLVACSSSASLIRRDQIGGRVQLHGAYMPAMADARMLMVERCRGRFDSVELGDAVEFRCKTHAAEQSTGGERADGASNRAPLAVAGR